MGRAPQSALLIVTHQSVKNTDTATHKGFDAGRKLWSSATLQWTPKGYRTPLVTRQK